MIKFFRKIRYNLMEAGKTGKYFKYAIGEIVLVVIGILIAIQLNEWRVESLNNNQKQIVLKALHDEFKANLEQMDTVLSYMEKIPKIYPTLNEMIRNPNGNYSEEEMSNAIVNTSYTWTFSPSNGALRSAITSGQIHLLENIRLIELLFSWEDVVKDSEEEAIRLRKYQYDFIKDELIKYTRIADIWKTEFPEFATVNNPSDFKGLFNDVVFEDYCSLSYSYALEYLTELYIIQNQNKTILTLIEDDLKTNKK